MVHEYNMYLYFAMSIAVIVIAIVLRVVAKYLDKKPETFVNITSMVSII